MNFGTRIANLHGNIQFAPYTTEWTGRGELELYRNFQILFSARNGRPLVLRHNFCTVTGGTWLIFFSEQGADSAVRQQHGEVFPLQFQMVRIDMMLFVVRQNFANVIIR